MNIKKISNVTCSLYFECVDFLEVHIFFKNTYLHHCP